METIKVGNEDGRPEHEQIAAVSDRRNFQFPNLLDHPVSLGIGNSGGDSVDRFRRQFP